jgi:hypothetical protein
MADEKDTLLYYLQRQRDALVWKLDGLSERQARWPVTPTGTNLLGIVKHVALMEYGYFGEVFGRQVEDPMLLDLGEAEPNTDMYATADESMTDVLDFYRRAWANTDACVAERRLDSPGVVPWWQPERRNVTLHTVLVHMIQEAARHAGHADIVRETLDGRTGLSPVYSNLPEEGESWWVDYVSKLTAIAEKFD